MAGEQPVLEVTWKGREIRAPMVASVEVEDHDRLIDKATIVLRDPQGTVPGLTAGDPITVTLGWSSEQAVLFAGQVVKTPAAAPASGVATVTVVAYDLSYLMHKEAKYADHEGKLSKIVQTIADGYKEALTVDRKHIVCDPDPEFTSDPSLRQHNLTDLQFLQWLAWRYGHRAFVEYNEDKSRFYFMSNQRLLSGEPMGALQWCHGLRQLKEFRYERVAGRAARQRLAAVPDPKTGLSAPTVGQLPPPVQPLEPAEPDPRAGATPPPVPEPAPVIGLPSDPRLAEAVTVLDPTQVLGLRGTGTAVGTIKLRAKGKVTIEGIAPWAEGDWYVNTAVHSWRDTTVVLAAAADTSRRTATYETRFTVTR
jgi:hypothetical protein